MILHCHTEGTNHTSPPAIIRLIGWCYRRHGNQKVRETSAAPRLAAIPKIRQKKSALTSAAEFPFFTDFPREFVVRSSQPRLLATPKEGKMGVSKSLASLCTGNREVRTT